VEAETRPPRSSWTWNNRVVTAEAAGIKASFEIDDYTPLAADGRAWDDIGP